MDRNIRSILKSEEGLFLTLLGIGLMVVSVVGVVTATVVAASAV